MTTGVRQALVLLVMLASAAAAVERPNLIVILADDLGYTDLACYGSRFYETPHLDALAAQGMKFTQGYACGPNCTPTRAALLSGQYGARTGIYTVGDIERFNWRSRPLQPVANVQSLPRRAVTLASALRAAGYVTGLVGKWHLGSATGDHPLDQGFMEFFGFLGGSHAYEGGKGILRNRAAVTESSYLTTAFGREAEDFIRRHRDQPFFLCLAFNAVHTPLQSPPERAAAFAGKPPAGGHKNTTYAGMLAALDEQVGRVLAQLDNLHLAERTLVIFTSDNGGVGGYRREHIQAEDITDNTPLRGGKGMLYEGGIRVPYLFRWPGQIAAGSTCDAPINSVDLYPTLLDLAGAPPPRDWVLDGHSYLNLLRGQPADARPPLFWHFPGYLGAGGQTWRTLPVSVIRDGDWKLMEFMEDGRQELYNLRTDVSEQHNRVEEQPAEAAALHRKLLDWRVAVQASMPRLRTGPGTKDNPAPKTRRKAP